MAEMTGDAGVIAFDSLWPGDIADCSADLLDVVFGWADFAKLRRLVAKHCAAPGLTGSRLDDFALRQSFFQFRQARDRHLLVLG